MRDWFNMLRVVFTPGILVSMTAAAPGAAGYDIAKPLEQDAAEASLVLTG